MGRAAAMVEAAAHGAAGKEGEATWSSAAGGEDEKLPNKTGDDNAATFGGTTTSKSNKRRSARRNRQRCAQFKREGVCSKGDLCEFSHSA